MLDDKRLKLAKEALESGSYDKETIEYIFPELKENEDDKIRKEIIDYIDKATGCKEWISWLEKQGEQKSNKVEPKFKVGDWIKCEDLNIVKIISINGDKYEVECNDGTIYFSHIDYIDSLYHLWTIEDAKDGDFLINYNDKVPFIFKGLLDSKHPNYPVAYCGVDDMDEFMVSSGNYFWEDSIVKPATIEQRKFLFSKMKEAGYEWDAKKKKLKKNKQERAIIDKNGNPVKIGDAVLWYDPDETTRDLSRVWAIDKINGEIITISDDYSEAEVYANEIEKF